MKIKAYNAHWKFCTISKNIKIHFFVCFVVKCIYLTGKQRNQFQLLNRTYLSTHPHYQQKTIYKLISSHLQRTLSDFTGARSISTRKGSLVNFQTITSSRFYFRLREKVFLMEIQKEQLFRQNLRSKEYLHSYSIFFVLNILLITLVD